MSLSDAGRLAYSPAEAAKALSISRAYVYLLIRRGALKAIKIGERQVIPRSALLRLLGEPNETDA